jgi:hypothetical protein
MILTADHKGRLTCAAIFTPRKTFSVNPEPDGSFRVVPMVELAPKQIPTPEQAREMLKANRFKVTPWAELKKDTREID